MNNLKFLLLLSLFSFWSLFTVSSYDVVSEEFCKDNFSEKEWGNVKFIKNFFETKFKVFESKIPESKVLVEDFVKKLDQTLICDNGYSDYSAFKSNLVILLQKVVKLQKSSYFVSDPEAKEAILDLQNHILNWFLWGYDVTKPFQQNTNWNIKVTVDTVWFQENSDSYAKVKFDLNLNSENKYNPESSEIESKIDFDWNVDFDLKQPEFDYESEEMLTKTYNWEVSFGADLEFIAKNNIYLKINSIDLFLDKLSISDEERFQVEMFKSMLDGAIEKLWDNYIKIDTSTLPSSSINLALLVQKLKTIPMIDFYRSWDVWYGSVNKNICSIVEVVSPFQKETCLYSIEESIKFTKWKWYIMMEKIWNDYVLSLTDKFADEKMPNGVDFSRWLYWNSNDITKLDITLNDVDEDLQQTIQYEYWNLDVSLKNSDWEFGFNWTITKSEKEFDIVWKFPGFDIDFIGKLKITTIENWHHLNLDFTIVSEWKVMFSGSVENEKVIKYLEKIEIIEPTNTIEIQDIMWFFNF